MLALYLSPIDNTSFLPQAQGEHPGVERDLL
jgi:hypothetical protein